MNSKMYKTPSYYARYKYSHKINTHKKQSHTTTQHITLQTPQKYPVNILGPWVPSDISSTTPCYLCNIYQFRSMISVSCCNTTFCIDCISYKYHILENYICSSCNNYHHPFHNPLYCSECDSITCTIDHNTYQPRIHYCGDSECEWDCGTLDCGCIDLCRGRCGLPPW
jgi:hypothetical protein